MNKLHRLFKTVQRKLLDFLLTKLGLSICLLSILIVIVSVIKLSDTILEYRLTILKNHFSKVIDFKNARILNKLIQIM